MLTSVKTAPKSSSTSMLTPRTNMLTPQSPVLASQWAVFFAKLDLPTDHGLLDTGAQSAVCGRSRWNQIVDYIAKQGLKPVQLAHQAMGTTQGIGGQVKVQGSYNLPIGIAGPRDDIGSSKEALYMENIGGPHNTIDDSSVTTHCDADLCLCIFWVAVACYDNLPVGVYMATGVSSSRYPAAVKAQEPYESESNVAQ
eukprot:4993255-Amphidinium_carterae.1